ncbi:unnamed protein product [Durusdinium trenchii]|uniref:Uncharacterized protein n=1 Tax=Durusdinium trenchii TaxID=1381693 RepID=A0ABP0RG91_9DINO
MVLILHYIDEASYKDLFPKVHYIRGTRSSRWRQTDMFCGWTSLTETLSDQHLDGRSSCKNVQDTRSEYIAGLRDRPSCRILLGSEILAGSKVAAVKPWRR